MTVDLVIPARNEEDNIPALLGALPWDFVRYVVVADNGSTDRTAELARDGGAVVVHEAQRGYGAACLACLAWLDGRETPPDVVAFIDADLADDPACLAGLCGPILDGRADLVIGSRVRLAQKGALTPPQRIGSLIASGLIRLITGRRFTDLGPMRAIRWSSLQSLKMADRTWGWTVEMQFKAAAHGLRTAELDVPYRPRRAGVSKISGSVIGSLRAGWKIIVTLAVLAWRSRGVRGRQTRRAAHRPSSSI